MPEAASILEEITLLFEAEPIGRIASFLQTNNGHQLKIAHGLCQYKLQAFVSTSDARHEFAYLGETRQGRCQLIQFAANMFNVTDKFKVLPPPGHIVTLEADRAKEYIPVLIKDNGVNQKLAACQSCFVLFEMMPLSLGGI